MNRAAPVLRESQPTLGRRMLRLERDIGFPLFERAPNRLVPTEAGEALAAALIPMLGAARSLASLSERFYPRCGAADPHHRDNNAGTVPV